jgi:hypothetical protein
MPTIPPPQTAAALGRVADDRSGQADRAPRFLHGRWLSANQPAVNEWQDVEFDVVVSHRSEVAEDRPAQLRFRFAANE